MSLAPAATLVLARDPAGPGARIRRWTGAGVFLYGTACAAVFAFLVYPAQAAVWATVDLNGFGLLSRSLAEGNGFSLGFGATIRRAPLFPFLGAALLKLFGTAGSEAAGAAAYRPIIAAQCVLLGLTCVVVWLLADRLFGRRAALVAAALCPLCPQSLRYVGMTEVEPLMGLLIALLAWTGLNLLERPGPATGGAFGLTAAAATLAKPIVLLYPPAFGVLAFWWWSRQGRMGPAAAVPLSARASASVALAVSFVLPLLPWTFRNAQVTGGKFIGISSNGPGEFLRGYVNAQPKYFLLRQDFGGSDPRFEKWDPEANAFEDRVLRQAGARFVHFNFSPDGRVAADALPDGVSSAQVEAEKDRIEGAEMKRRLLREPFGFLRKLAIQVGTFWYVVETRTKSVLAGVLALVVLGLAGAGVARARRQGTVTLPVIAVLAYFNLMYAAFLALARYSMPLYPTLMALVAGGLLPLIEWLGRRLRPDGSFHPGFLPGAAGEA